MSDYRYHRASFCIQQSSTGRCTIYTMRNSDISFICDRVKRNAVYQKVANVSKSEACFLLWRTKICLSWSSLVLSRRCLDLLSVARKVLQSQCSVVSKPLTFASSSHIMIWILLVPSLEMLRSHFASILRAVLEASQSLGKVK